MATINKYEEVKRLVGTLDVSQWKSPEEFSALRMQRLSQLFEHAYQTIPFYKDKLDQIDYNVGQTITSELFSQLPIISREEVREAQKTTLISTLVGEESYTYDLATSGSTGVAVRLLGTFSTECYWKALCIREHHWHERNFKNSMAAIRWGDRNFGLAPLGETYANWGHVTKGIYDTGPGFFLNIVSSTGAQIAWLKKMQPNYLITFPSQLKVLLRQFIDDDIQFEKLLEIRAVGETVDDELRKLATEYGIKLTDGYSSEEFGPLAFECPEEKNYHVQSENVYLEIVDEDGNPCEIGQPGRVIVTGLHNFATSLIRYDIGDFSQFGEPCSCGRHALPVLEKILGRKRNRLTMPDGESRFAFLGDREERRKVFRGTKKFQYVQHTPTNIELKLVVEKEMTPEQHDAMVKIIQKDFGYPFDIDITYHDDIPRQASGKFEEFVSLI